MLYNAIKDQDSNRRWVHKIGTKIKVGNTCILGCCGETGKQNESIVTQDTWTWTQDACYKVSMILHFFSFLLDRCPEV